MGVISALFWYGVGKRKAKREVNDDDCWVDNYYEDVCTNCGYRESQHSDQGDCPTY